MVLNVAHLSVQYPGFTLRPVSFQMERGEILAVIGESGSGKTTLAKAITCLLGEEAQVEGRVSIDGNDLLSMTERERKKLRMTTFSIAFQSSAQYLNPSMTLRKHLEEILDRAIPRPEQAAKMLELMDEVGLSGSDLKRYPRELSGGMAQKFLLACAVALRPGLVILDEPTSSLDRVSGDEFVSLVQKLNRNYHIAFLVITHDMKLASRLSQRILVLYEGSVMELGRTAEVIDRPRHPYTRGLLHASINLNIVRDIWGIPPSRTDAPGKGCPFFGRCTQSIAECGTRAPDLLKQPDGRMVACNRGGIVTLLEGRNLSKSFGPQQILKDCSVSVCAGEIVAVIGKSGVGKTTMARILSGYDQEEYEGKVIFEGAPARFDQLHRTKHGVQMVFQDSEASINPRMRVLQAVAEPLTLCDAAHEEILSAVEAALRDVDLPTTGDFLQKKIRTLSGGQKQRVSIARALTMEPKLLIADEPTSMLDPSSCANVLRMLRTLQNKRGFSMLIITHDLDSAVKISDSIYLLKDQTTVRVNPSDYVSTNLNELLKHRGIEPGQVFPGGRVPIPRKTP